MLLSLGQRCDDPDLVTLPVYLYASRVFGVTSQILD